LALPPSSIPEFNGEYLDWPQFHDLFVELVHNKSYSASQKLNIFPDSLRVEARNVLTDTAFSKGGYDDTWLRLKATIGQPLQAMDASDPKQQIPMINKVSALALEQ